MPVRVTLRAICIGALLMPPNAFWLMQMELVWGSTYPSTIPLLSTVVFTLCLLLGLNQALRRWIPRMALTQGELLTIYVMLAIGTALNGTDVMQTLPHLMSTPFWHATPENEWQELFFAYLPSWLTVGDRDVLRGFYEGESTFYTWEHLRAWLVPALFWCAFAAVCLFVMLCINVVLRRRWTDHERLAYPIVQLPYEITGGDGKTNLWRNRLLWMGFAMAGGIDLLNGISFLYPQVPMIPVKGHNIGQYFTERPFNVIGWMPVTFYPFAMGIGFLMPLDLCFSAWFFYLFWRAEKVLGAALGWYSLPGFPFYAEQIAGVWIALLGFAFWGGRRYFANVLRNVLSSSPQVEEPQEPLSYRAAIVGILMGMGAIVLFCHQAGMRIWVAIAFFGIYFAISTAITRIRAELGPPVQNLRDSGPDSILTNWLGIRRFQKSDLTVMSLFFWLNGEAYRSHPMPHQLEGFKLADRIHMDSRRLVWAMVIASLVAALSAFWGVLHYAYKLGSSVSFNGPAARYFAFASYRRLARWLAYPADPDFLGMAFTGISFTGTLGLLFLRTRILWWPLHPVGYAISYWWAMNLLWFPLFLSWAIKLVLLKHGGVHAYRRMLPFFLGLILGEYIMGSLWSILGMILQRRMYAFWV